MKILVITDLYPIKENENTPSVIKGFVREWENSGHEVRIIRPNFLLNSFLRGKTFYGSGMYGNIENINYFLPFIGNIGEKVKTEFEPDITIAHMPSGIIFANRIGLKFCAGVHCSDIEVLTNPLYSIYFKSELEKAYENACGIACRSEVLKKKFLKLYPKYENKTFTAYSGIEPSAVVCGEWRNRSKIKVLTCAQFIKRKNIDKVIEACDKFPEIELTVAGSGRLEKYLKNLSSKPVFIGELPRQKVLELMRENDIFILPSVKETFGMVYLEAMASGCVTVCSKDEAVDGIIKDGINGYTAENGDVEGILRRILHSDNSVILKNAYNTIQNYTSQIASKNYLDNAIQKSSVWDTDKKV